MIMSRKQKGSARITCHLHFSAINREYTALTITFNVLEILKDFHIVLTDLKINLCIALHMCRICRVFDTLFAP